MQPLLLLLLFVYWFYIETAAGVEGIGRSGVSGGVVQSANVQMHLGLDVKSRRQRLRLTIKSPRLHGRRVHETWLLFAIILQLPSASFAPHLIEYLLITWIPKRKFFPAPTTCNFSGIFPLLLGSSHANEGQSAKVRPHRSENYIIEKRLILRNVAIILIIG